MSVEDEKGPRKAPAKKKAVAPAKEGAADKKVKAAAAPKAVAAPKKKTAAKSVNGTVTAVPAHAPDIPQLRTAPTYEQIAERAHAYFVNRGCLHGFHEEDWFQAERDLWAGL
ncbi:MAG TPA: DUF2934 domain-containing protein [Edaphobacter sp.]|jgi:hypothetical protein|nr:DUF2934 domain-containing protein [Edaphobacter sp.]